MRIRRHRMAIRNELSKERFTVSHGIIERDGLLKDLERILDFIRGDLQRPADFFSLRLSSELLSQSAGRPYDAVRRFSHVHGDSNRARLVGQRSRNALTHPPGRIGAELKTLSVLIALGGFHQSDVPFLNEI